MAKQKSRTTRWQEAAEAAFNAFEELVAVQEEYQEWLDNLPENFQGSALGDKLEEVCNMDLESARDTADEAMNVDLPMGFGRD